MAAVLQATYLPTITQRPNLAHPVGPVVLEICAGAGGQSLGLEQAGFGHVALVENDVHACATLRANRPNWNILETDVRMFSARGVGRVDLFAAGVPCPPFSHAGKQMGSEDERDLFPDALRLIEECTPAAIMIENVRGLLDPRFDAYRASIVARLDDLGYRSTWRLVRACDFGVPQLRPRSVLVGLMPDAHVRFCWPAPRPIAPPTVGECLGDLMASRGWEGAEAWIAGAAAIAPTLVGGSKRHGGPDLGPTRAKRQWADLGVDGMGIADQPPVPGFTGTPRLTVRMAARLQGFPDDWRLSGSKTAAYKQVGNAFPPPVAHALGTQILKALTVAAGTTG